MTAALLKKLVRNFPENGPKLLLENPANVRDLLAIVHEPVVENIDFTAMTVERTHFVQPDYEHVTFDFLLKAPLNISEPGSPEGIFIYLLLEHQSSPERFFLLRLIEYLVEVYKTQKRAWDKRHDSDAGFLLQPVVPIVLYTGERPWPKLEALVNLVWQGERFQEMIPVFRPHFLNLRESSRETLADDGGFFGQVLWLIRQRHAETEIFQATLQEVVADLEHMPAAERARWTGFLSYIVALVYHARSEPEHEGLREVVDHSVQSDEHRKEYTKMGRTIAEMFMDKGRVEGRVQGKEQEAFDARRKILLRQLRKRFKKVPRNVQERINGTTNLQELEAWLDNVVDARNLGEVGIPLN
jgi:hypothetical protein